MDGQARFFISSPDQSISTEPLGLWQTRGFEDSYAIDDRPEDSIMWEVDLPGDDAAAKWIMNERLTSLRLTQDALPEASSLFQDYVRDEQDPESVDYGIVSSTVVEGSTALQELSRWMMFSGTEADYSVTGDIEEKLRSAFEELEAFYGHLRQSLAHMAFIQTRSGGRVLGATRVAWLGDVKTNWMPGLSMERAALHRMSVSLALGTRRTWIRLGMLVTGSAARLGAVASSGIGLVTALPMAYRTITQLVQEIRQLKMNRVVDL
jgi:hypothetical protein